MVWEWVAPVTVLGIYVSSSFLLLKFPTILHKRKPRKFRAFHISHRGGAAERYENTIEAFEWGRKCGAEMFELDVQLTKDEIVVIAHDNHLKRLCGVDNYISALPYMELPSIRENLCVTFHPDCVIHGHKDRSIARLEDLFGKFPSVPMNIDVKDANPALLENVAVLIEQYKREQLTVWGNRSSAVTDNCFRRNPSVGLLFGLRSVVGVSLAFVTGLLPFIPLTAQFYEVPLPRSIRPLLQNSADSRARTVLLSCLFWFVDRMIVSRTLIQHLQARGIQVFVWVVNAEEDFVYCTDTLKVDGIMTDLPTRLSDFLRHRNAKEPTNYESMSSRKDSPLMKEENE